MAEKLITPKIGIEVQGHFLKVKVPQKKKAPPRGMRGVISDFSRASRKRMIELIARIDEKLAGFICFVTLTYPDRSGPPSALQTARDLRAFLKRLGRMHPGASAIWRREWERRKSGVHVDEVFPHFHIIFFNLPFVHRTDINEFWSDVIGHDEYVRTEIRGLQNWKHAFRYVAKYMTKIPRGDFRVAFPSGGGEAPDREGPPTPDGTRDSASGSLVYISYPSEHMTNAQQQKTGRSWGKFNESKLPLGALSQLELNRFWLIKLKERAKQDWRAVNDDPELGFTLFVEDMSEWNKLIAHMQEREIQMKEEPWL